MRRFIVVESSFFNKDDFITLKNTDDLVQVVDGTFQYKHCQGFFVVEKFFINKDDFISLKNTDDLNVQNKDISIVRLIKQWQPSQALWEIILYYFEFVLLVFIFSLIQCCVYY